MKQLFFDFDGTIVDSATGIVDSLQHAVSEVGLPQLTEDQYRLFIGPALSETFPKFYPDLTESTLMAAIKHFQAHYRAKGMFEMTVYPGVTTALDALAAAGYQLNIASAKPESMLATIIPNMHLSHYFTGVYGATDDEHVRSRKDQVLAYGLAKAQADPAFSLMIGDRDSDINGGSANGVKTLGVTYGFGSRAELMAAKATAIVPAPAALPAGVAKLIG